MIFFSQTCGSQTSPTWEKFPHFLVFFLLKTSLTLSYHASLYNNSYTSCANLPINTRFLQNSALKKTFNTADISVIYVTFGISGEQQKLFFHSISIIMKESPSWLGAKNWACCPLSVTLYWRVTMRMDVKIVVLNCQKCNECLNCHKFPGLLFEAVFKISLSLSMSLSLYLSFCWSGHVFLSHSRIALWRCPAPLVIP